MSMPHWIVRDDTYYTCPTCRYTYDNRIDHVSAEDKCPNCQVPIGIKPHNPVYEAYKILVNARDNNTDFDIDEVIGYLGEALD